MFGLSFDKLIILGVLAVAVLGPERLPDYARRLAKFVRDARLWTDTAKNRMRDELGDQDLDWRALDPRQYDPRRIIREALSETPAPRPVRVSRPADVTPTNDEIHPPTADEAEISPLSTSDERPGETRA